MKRIVAIGIAVFLACLVLIPSASATWCDANYGKKAPIFINNTAGSEQTYYQIELNFTHDSDMNVNFSDIRVYNDSDCSLIPLWNESAVASSWNKIWFNATNVPASAWCNDTYYLYYNYSSASSVSNGTNTFGFSDDFEDGDTSDWTNEGSNTIVADAIAKSGSYSGNVTVTGVVGDETYKSFTATTEAIFEFDARFKLNTNYVTISLDETAGSYLDSVFLRIANTGALEYYDGSYHNLDTLNADQWYKFKIITHSVADTFDIWINDTNKGSGLGTRGNIDTGIRAIALSGGGSAGGILYIDNIFSRVYASTEPSATLGSEESQEVGIPAISNKQPTPPITKSPLSSDFSINASIDITANNHWEINRTGSYEHLEWDNGTTTPTYTFSPITEGEGSYTVKLTAYNTTVPSKNSSTTWGLTIANINLSSPSPGITATKYVSNKSITYSATVNRTADCKWNYQNGTLIEWDNSTASPSTELWINSTTTAFNISLTAYDTGCPTDNDTILWNNSITDDIFDYTNYTWERWDLFSGEGFVGWTGNIPVGDVDNDGTDEIVCMGSEWGPSIHNKDILIYELNGTYTHYENITSESENHAYSSIHNIDSDETNELLCLYAYASPNAFADLFRFNTTSLTNSKLGTAIQTGGSNNAHGLGWMNISNEEHFYSAYCGEGQIVHNFINFTTDSKTEIDDFGVGCDAVTWDIDNDGVKELIVSEGWGVDAEKIWLYEINQTTGAYTSKTMIFDNDSSGNLQWSAALKVGDVDNDGIDNLIIMWQKNHYAPYVLKIEAYEFDGITVFGEGNYSEVFEIDTHTSWITNTDSWPGQTVIGDIDNDGKNELVMGTYTYQDASYYLGDMYVFKYDIGANGASVNRTTLFQASKEYMGYSTYKRPSITPAIFNYNGKNHLFLAVLKQEYNSAVLETEFFVMTSIAGDTYTPPNPTNLQNSTGNFWVNYTWSPDSGNVTNGYNVTWNSSWYNTTNTYMNKSVGASNWANITVWAWNSSGSGTMSAGNVSDQVQAAAADTTFTVSLPTGYTKPVFQPPNSTATNYPPNGQSSSQEFYNVTNSGNVNLDVRMQLNATVSTITLKADSDNDYVGAKEVNTTLVTIHPNLGQGNSVDIWLWSDFDHTPAQTANRTVYINVSES